MTPAAYNTQFFSELQRTSHASARVVIPILLELIPVASVVDLGCGEGAWLNAFSELGVTEILGADGDYVDTGSLLIPGDKFIAADLSCPFQVAKRYDLAVCLEVGEHIPRQSADVLVSSLVGLSDAILFSAAIPGQGGTRHVNEQWPAYWAEKFCSHGFVALDCLRHKLWNDVDVAWWFRQNMILYVKSDRISRLPEAAARFVCHSPLPLVHPELYAWKTSTREMLSNIRARVFSKIRFPGKDHAL